MYTFYYATISEYHFIHPNKESFLMPILQVAKGLKEHLV